MYSVQSLTQTVNHTHGTELLLQGERNFNRFGGWLGKNSTYGKKMRLLEDVHVHLLASHACEPTRYTVCIQYISACLQAAGFEAF
jgi:replication factor C subunit 1